MGKEVLAGADPTDAEDISPPITPPDEPSRPCKNSWILPLVYWTLIPAGAIILTIRSRRKETVQNSAAQ